METIQHTTAPDSKSTFRFRSAVVLAGIAIAIICSLVSLKDVQYGEEKTSQKFSPSFEVSTKSLLNTSIRSAVTFVKLNAGE